MEQFNNFSDEKIIEVFNTEVGNGAIHSNDTMHAFDGLKIDF